MARLDASFDPRSSILNSQSSILDFSDASCGLFTRCATIPVVDGLRIFYTFST